MSVNRKMKATRENVTLEFEIPYPETFAEAEEMYGVEIAFDIFKAGLDIRAQSAARGLLTQKDPETKELMHTAKDVPDLMKEWVPSKSHRRLSEADRIKKAIGNFSPDALREALAELTKGEGASSPEAPAGSKKKK